MIFAALTSDTVLSGIVAISLTILFIILFLRKLRQPYFIAYILSGVLLGKEGIGVIEKPEIIAQFGELGLILLMFFIGAEIKLPDLTTNFKKPVLGALSQVFLSFACMTALGVYMGWNWKIIILLSFVISLSSSAIIFQYLSQNKELNSPLGLLTGGVLLVQDILVVPMLITLNFMGKGELETFELLLACLGGILIIAFLRAAMKHRLFKIPFYEGIQPDHDLQVFIGFAICFGFAWVTHFFGLSAALGAFLAGILIGHDQSTHWLQKSMMPFRVFFLAFFFLSIGLQIDLSFLYKNIGVITAIVFIVLIVNSLLNSLIFRSMKISWRDSVYAGALLSQIGEFSFVLSLTAYNLNIISDYSYQITLLVITLTMMLTTIWISVIQQLIFKIHKPVFESLNKLSIKKHLW